ncbi:indole-3-glycerol phosphate synthase TrpC [Kyrpidia spormannii]|uniref:Indole-3-glycerol phosphate synthase n=1 Tax=Kyrpidia spormannii TaxID=2055160 RepID=A0A2K8N6B2_9BACL|nr:indole-3-glycerol phosphate synthase TrpC [Kyrpidia spormannii]ATY84843.1 indole-3-glycerol phosphate synthase TrpC [Kyrpidia spormannii]
MTILERIVEEKKQEVPALEANVAAWEPRLAAAPPVRDFRAALEQGAMRRVAGAGVGLIAEVKKASPSKGVIRQDFDPLAIAEDYVRGGADCMSVLTDRTFFQGDPGYLEQIRKHADVPLLRKDFIIDERQVWEARCLGADAVLLITAILPNDQLERLIAEVRRWGMTPLVEVHSEEEMDRAAGAGADVIGVNNRDLRTFQVDLGVTERLVPRAPKGAFVISESGISAPEDVRRVREAGARAILVGESLMRRHDVIEGIEFLVGSR